MYSCIVRPRLGLGITYIYTFIVHCYIGPLFAVEHWKVNSVLIQLFAIQQILLNMYLS